MSRIIVYAVYSFFYIFYYTIPAFLIWDLLGVIIKPLHDQLKFVFFGIVAALFYVALYRSKLAIEAYDQCEYRFWTAHKVSGAILKANLSLLPIIGNFFKKSD